MAARDNQALYRAFGNRPQDNTMGYVAPGDGIRNNIRDYFNAHQGVSGLAPEEQASAQNALGPNQFTDANGWTYVAQPYANGTAGRNMFYAYAPGEIERARATGGRAKAGAYDADTGEFLYEQEMTSKADSARGLKLGLAAVGGMFGLSQLGLLGPGIANAGNIGATGAMEGVVGAGGMNAPGLAAVGVPGNPMYGAESASGVPPNPGYTPGAEGGIPPNPMLEGGGSGSILDKLGGAAQTVIDTPLGKMSLGQIIAGITGAAVGAKGEKQSQTQTSKMDPRMEPYIFGSEGQPGLLQYAQGLLAKQMAPEYQAGFDQMRNTGLGLLATPVAGNGVGKVPYGGLGPGLLAAGTSVPGAGMSGARGGLLGGSLLRGSSPYN